MGAMISPDRQTQGRSGTRSRRVHRTAIAVLMVTSITAACSSSDDDADDDAPTDDAVAEAGADSEDGAGEDAGGDDGSGPSTDAAGSGILRIDGVTFDGMEGDCDISRDFGGSDVGDLATRGLEVIVAVDNVDAEDPPSEDDQNFVMINEESFRVLNQPGTIDSITESGARTADGSRDLVRVVFAGTLDDGRAVEAELDCILQNEF